MKVFVAGATGALGVPVVRRLIADGHEVTGLSRTAQRKHIITGLGAHAIVADALDRPSLQAAVASCAPEAVVHALTAIPKRGPLRASDLTPTNKLRVEGTRNLLDSAILAGAGRIVVESMVFIYGYGDLGPKMVTEGQTPARTALQKWMILSLQALIDEETCVLEASRAGKIESIVLRFGGFYGPGAGLEMMARMLRKRLLPLPRGGRSSGAPWIHVDDAASAVIAALYRGRPSEIYNIVDDHPARFTDLIEDLARAIGAPHPLSVPRWLIRAAAAFMQAAWLDTTMRVSNTKAKQELQWSPRFRSYRDGIADFAAALGKPRA